MAALWKMQTSQLAVVFLQTLSHTHSHTQREYYPKVHSVSFHGAKSAL